LYYVMREYSGSTLAELHERVATLPLAQWLDLAERLLRAIVAFERRTSGGEYTKKEESSCHAGSLSAHSARPIAFNADSGDHVRASRTRADQKCNRTDEFEIHAPPIPRGCMVCHHVHRIPANAVPAGLGDCDQCLRATVQLAANGRASHNRGNDSLRGWRSRDARSTQRALCRRSDS